MVVAALVTLGVLALVGGAGAALAARFGLGYGGAGAVAAALLTMGFASYSVMWATYASVAFGVALAVTVIVASVVALVVLRAYVRRVRRTVVPLALVIAGVLIATLGLFNLWHVDRDRFEYAMTRTVSWPLPSDNAIPSLLADWFLDADRPHFLIGDWLPSDRPPLQAGIILLTRPVLEVLPWLKNMEPPHTLDFGISVAAQSCGMLAVAGLLWALGYTTRVVLGGAAFLAAVPTTYVNTVFTWPKILAGAYMVSAVAVLVGAARRRGPAGAAVIMAASLSVLGILAHGGAVFVLPAVAVLCLVQLRRQGATARIGTVATAVGVAAVVYAPWAIFQRVVAPPGDRLLKWHLAGVVSLDDRNFVQALGDQYLHASPYDLVGARLSNLGAVLWPDVFAGWDVWVPGWQDRVQRAQFYDTAAALGIAFLLICLLCGVAIRNARRSVVDPFTRDAVGLVIAMGACIGLWALILFQADAAIVHQGSQAWMMVLSAVPFAWIARRAPRIAFGVVLPLQVAVTIVVYAPSAFYEATNARPLGVATLVIGLLCVLAGLVSAPQTGVRTAEAYSDTPIWCTRSSGSQSLAPDR